MLAPELCRHLEGRLSASLSPKRAAHSRRVATLAAELCSRRGLDPDRGRAAGLAHDLLKEAPLPEQRGLYGYYREYTALSGHPCPDLGLGESASELYHGPAAAALLVRDYGVHDPDLLEAVAYHTVGRPDLGLLATLVYCADKLEPSRTHVDGAFREACMALEPRDMLRAVVEDLVAWLSRKGWEIAPETLLLYNSLAKPVGAP